MKNARIYVAVALAFIVIFSLTVSSMPFAKAFTCCVTIPGVGSVGKNPSDVAVNEKTNMIYVTNPNNRTVFIINGATNTVVKTITITKGFPHSIGIDAYTNKFFVGNFGGPVSIFNGNNNALEHGIKVGQSPIGIGVNPKTNLFYVTNPDDNTTSVISGKNNTLVHKIHVGYIPFSVGVDINRNMIYVVNFGDGNKGSVSVINGSTSKVVSTITVGKNPVGVGVNSNTHKIYVPNPYANTVSVINGKTNAIIHTIPVAGNPTRVAVDSTRNLIYVSNGTNTITVIDGSTNKVVDNIGVGQAPSSIGVNSITDKIYVVNRLSRTVSVISG